MTAVHAALPRLAATTASQRRDWLVNERTARPASLNTGVLVQFPADVAVQQCTSALDVLSDRHAALRTTFEQRGNALHQVVHPEPLAQADVVETAESRASSDWQLAAISREFDLANGCPFSTTISRGSDGLLQVALVLHHIISDQTSLQILARDLTHLLRVELGQKLHPLPDIDDQFADYADTWNRKYENGDLSQELDFWHRQFEGAPLYSQIGISSRESSPAETTTFEMEGAEWHSLERSAARLGTTPYIALATAFVSAMSRLEGQQEQVVGCGFANRLTDSVQYSVGRFSHNMGLRLRSVDVSNSALREVVSHNTESALMSYANASVSRDAYYETRGWTAPYYLDVAFQLVDDVGSLVSDEAEGFSILPLEPVYTKQPLNVACVRSENTLSTSITYSRTAIDRQLVQGLHVKFIEAVRDLVHASA